MYHFTMGATPVSCDTHEELRAALAAPAAAMNGFHATSAPKAKPKATKATKGKQGASPTKKRSRSDLLKLPYIEGKLDWDTVEKAGKALNRDDKMQLRSDLKARQALGKDAT